MRETILVASDLHLNVGRSRDTGTYDRRENFLADEEFRRWLTAYRQPAGSGSRATLVLAGDTFDFIRIDSVPNSEVDYKDWADLLDSLGEGETARRVRRLAVLSEGERRARYDAVVSRKEARFGFGTQDYKTVWKLLLIYRGHGPVFKALGDWVDVGGRLVVIKGNHDLELHWTLVQKAVRHLISPAAPVARIQFEEESWQEGNIYVEHGHRWEAMTAVHTRTAWLPRRPDEISLPLGSFVNRYLINGIERLDPFIDNVKPVNAALGELLRKYPLTILTLWTRGIRFLWRTPRVKGFFCSLSAAFQVLALIVAPPVIVVGATLVLGQRFFPGLERYSFLDWPIRLVGGGLIGGASIQMLLPLAVSVVRDLKRLLGFRSQDALQEAAERLSPVVFSDLPLVPAYIVMGHTHRQQMTSLNTTAAFYANCGTWVPIWPRDRIDLAGRVFLSFVEFTWEPDLSAYIGETKRWNDDAGAAQPAKLFEELDA